MARMRTNGRPPVAAARGRQRVRRIHKRRSFQATARCSSPPGSPLSDRGDGARSPPTAGAKAAAETAAPAAGPAEKLSAARGTSADRSERLADPRP